MNNNNLIEEQRYGVSWIESGFQKHKGVILADRMGYGKTPQAIEVLRTSVKENPVLIICPSYIVHNWLEELKKWNVNNTVCIIDSSKQILEQTEIYITSYDMATKYEFVFNQLFKKTFSLIVCDESHYLKSWNSLRSKRILGTYKNKKTNLLNRTENILCLTGTPVLNRIEELYNVLIRIAPEALRNCTREQFIEHFAAEIFYTPWGMKHKGVKNEKKLKSLLKDVVLSRQKIHGLKDRYDKHIFIEIKGAELKKLIQEEEEYLRQYNIDSYSIETIQKLAMIEGSHISEVRQRAALLKIPVFLQVFEDTLEKESQLLIYCYHRNVQEALVNKIEKKFPQLNIGVINGSVQNKKRYEIIMAYQNKEIDLIIATIGALKEGVNITAGNVVMFIEYDWTPANIEQAICRVHRKGQENHVHIFYFMLKGGIDRYVLKMLTEKDNTIKKIIG